MVNSRTTLTKVVSGKSLGADYREAEEENPMTDELQDASRYLVDCGFGAQVTLLVSAQS
jgi:hypothetical protein